ncbi:MAG: Gfo/Idh/MocA family oxidoreductase [Pseudomonadota bacterium]
MKTKAQRPRPKRFHLPQSVVDGLQPVGIGCVGAGFVFDAYMQTHHLHPWLDLRAVFDRDTARARQVKDYFGTPMVDSLEAILGDPSISIVLNLTNPSEHFAVTKALLEAGKHVYSEKPLATTVGEARALAQLAEARGLQVGCAPSSLFGEAAQTLWRALRRGQIGQPRMVIANLDEGASHHQNLAETLINPSGAKWPAWDEYRVGCTAEHAGYVLTWMVAFFGSVRRVMSYSKVFFPDKGIPIPVGEMAPDYATAMLEFENGVVAQINSSVVTPPNHGLYVVGETGYLKVDHVWPFACPVTLVQHARPWLTETVAPVSEPVWDPKGLSRPWYYRHWRLRDYLLDPADRAFGVGDDKMRGVTEFMLAIASGQPYGLGGDFSAHITEVTYAIQDGTTHAGWQDMTTRAPAIQPPSWVGG